MTYAFGTRLRVRGTWGDRTLAGKELIAAYWPTDWLADDDTTPFIFDNGRGWLADRALEPIPDEKPAAPAADGRARDHLTVGFEAGRDAALREIEIALSKVNHGTLWIVDASNLCADIAKLNLADFDDAKIAELEAAGVVPMWESTDPDEGELAALIERARERGLRAAWKAWSEKHCVTDAETRVAMAAFNAGGRTAYGLQDSEMYPIGVLERPEPAPLIPMPRPDPMPASDEAAFEALAERYCRASHEAVRLRLRETELLAANNIDVERRRAAEGKLAAIAALIGEAPHVG